MNKPVRVLHVFGALNPGGVETLVMNLYRAIDRSEIQFDFALTEGKESFFDEEVKSLGGRCFYFDRKKSIAQNLSAVLRQNEPFCAVHSHIYFYSGNVLRIASKAGVPVRIAHAHNTSFGQAYTLRRRAYEWLMRKWILKYATDMLGCSTDACRFVFGNDCMDDPRCSVFYNAFDVDAFAFDEKKAYMIKRRYGIEDSFVVGHVGRFETQKNHTQLVEQFASIHAMKPDSVLLCVGRGSLMDDIRAKCETLGVGDAVIFAGAQKDTPAYYSAMDVFLFPSLYEGLGSVLIEAQANGLSCVTTEREVPNDVNITGNVVFVPLDAPAEKWAKTVLSCTERVSNIGANCAVKAHYDVGTAARNLSRVYLREKE